MSDSLVTPWTVAHPAPSPMGFPRREHWSGLPFPSPGDLPSCSLECYLLICALSLGDPAVTMDGKSSHPIELTEDKSATPTQTVAISMKQINKVTSQEIRWQGGAGEFGGKVGRSFQW